MSSDAADWKGVMPRMLRLGMWFATAFAIAFPLLLVLVLLSVLPPTVGGERVELGEWMMTSAPLYAVASGLMAGIAYALYHNRSWSRELAILLWVALLVYNAAIGLLGAVPTFEAWRAMTFCLVLGGVSVWYFYFKPNVVAYYESIIGSHAGGFPGEA